MPASGIIQQAIQRIDSENLKINRRKKSVTFLKESTSVNLGAIAKGFALEKAMNKIKDHNLLCAVFNFGGQIVYLKIHKNCGEKKFAIEKAQKGGKPVIWKMNTSGSLATSGNYEKYFTHKKIRYGHIFDPATGHPVNHIFSVTVSHPSPTLADAWATALFILGPTHEKRILKLYPKMKIKWVFN